MRLMRRLCIIYLCAAVLLGASVLAMRQFVARGSATAPVGRNAAWLDHRWVAASQSGPAIAVLCALSRLHGIGTIYVHVGPIDGSGAIVVGRAPAAGRFITTVHAQCPGVRVLAWLNGLLPRWDGLVDLARAAVRARLAATAAHFVALGFDGVQYDLEPVPDGDPDFLDLLRQTRLALGDHVLAIAAPALLPPGGLPRLQHLRLPLSPWSTGYYTRVAALVDELDPMLYETALHAPGDYTRFVAEQAGDLTRLLPGASIRLGLPAFSGRTAVFDDQAETLASGLAGVAMAFPTGIWPPSLAGITLYALWTMTPDRWSAYDRWRATLPVQ